MCTALLGSPDVSAMNEREQADVHHIPRGAVIIAHEVQCHGNMRVTVVTTKVVLEGKRR